MDATEIDVEEWKDEIEKDLLELLSEYPGSIVSPECLKAIVDFMWGAATNVS